MLFLMAERIGAYVEDPFMPTAAAFTPIDICLTISLTCLTMQPTCSTPKSSDPVRWT